MLSKIQPRHVFFCLLLLIFPGRIFPVEAKAPGMIFYQDSQMYGNQIVHLDANRIKLNWTQLKVTIEMSGPSWHVQVFNDKHKTYCDLTFKEWQTAFVGKKEVQKEHKWIFIEDAPEFIAGLKATHYRGFRFFRRLSPAQQKKAAAEMEARAQAPARKADVYKILKGVATLPPGLSPGPDFHFEGLRKEVWVTTEVSVPAQLAASMSRSSGLPPEYGVPLRIKEVHKGGRDSLLLDTNKFKREQIPDSVFACPKGYRKVADFMSTITGIQNDSDLQALFADDSEIFTQRKSQGSGVNLPLPSHRLPTGPANNSSSTRH